MTHKTAVIGGGPAGATVAIQLARSGDRVCLFERTLGPHDKVCGEFISWEAAHYLESLGLEPASLGALPVSRICLFSGGKKQVAELPFLAWSLSRRSLDDALLDQAEHAGVCVERGTAVKGLSRSDNGWELTSTVRRESTNYQARFEAEAVFLASGKHDLRNLRREHSGHQDLIGLKMHLGLDRAQQQALKETVEVHLYDGGYAGLELVEGGKANLCFLIQKDIYTKVCHNDWSEVLTWLGNRSPYLKARLAGARSLWPKPLAVYGTPYGYIHARGSPQPGLFRLGDQMAVIPSFAGDGIAMAMHSAILAAGIHTRGGDVKSYYRKARKEFERPVRNARILDSLMSHSTGRKLAILTSGMPGVMTRAINSTRLYRELGFKGRRKP